MSSPEKLRLLSGPFGSRMNDLHKISAERAFAENRIQAIRGILNGDKYAGVTQPVAPTYGATARGVHGGKFSPEMRRRNIDGVRHAREIFQGVSPFGSVASLIRNDIDRMMWDLLPDKIARAKALHTPQFEALADGGIEAVLCEALQDLSEAIGLVQAAVSTKIKRIILSFDPWRGRGGLPAAEWSPDTPLPMSYEEVQKRLREYATNETKVDLGLNCGNIRTITTLVQWHRPGTFAAVYPNQCAIPAGKRGEEFLALAHKNDGRSDDENTQFTKLRSAYEVQDDDLDRLINVCVEKGVENIGLCCGASPKHIRKIARKIAAL